MARRVRKTLTILGVLLLLLVLVLFGIWRALRHEPEFWQEAVQVDRAIYEEASDEMVRRTMAFRNTIRHEGDWEAVFTAQQINGWLAVDLVENHGESIPKSVSDPRVAIEPGRMLLACRLGQGKTASVVSLAIEPDMPEPNVITLRLCKARAGALPMPLSDVLDQITKAATDAGFDLHWRQEDGDPVAVVTLSSLHDADDRLVRIESIELLDEEIRLTGSTVRRADEGE